MKIYRHLLSDQLYFIELLINDIHHLNCNEFAGVYAYPYAGNPNRDTIIHRIPNWPVTELNTEKFMTSANEYISANFNIVSET